MPALSKAADMIGQEHWLLSQQFKCQRTAAEGLEKGYTVSNATKTSVCEKVLKIAGFTNVAFCPTKQD
jgi:hypothetical protein